MSSLPLNESPERYMRQHEQEETKNCKVYSNLGIKVCEHECKQNSDMTYNIR